MWRSLSREQLQVGFGYLTLGNKSDPKSMRSVRAIYDGKTVQLLERVEASGPVKVIVTFLDDEDDGPTGLEIAHLASASGAFDFLNDPAEDVYTLDDLKVRFDKNDK